MDEIQNSLSKKQAELKALAEKAPGTARLNGYTKFPNKLLDNKDLGAYGAIIYLAILSRAMKKESSFPSITRIAEDAMCSRNTVMKYTKKLETLGLISVHRPKRNSRKTNTYTPKRLV